MNTALQNAKDPAATAIAPGHGSDIPHKETKMNVQTTITAEPIAPASDYALAKAIYRYRADRNDYLARTLADDAAPDHSEGSYHVLRTWKTPATSWHDAEQALRLAFEEQEAGDAPLVGPMLKAVIDWMQNERFRKHPTVLQDEEPFDDLVRIGKLTAEHRQTLLLWNDFGPFADENDKAFDPAMVPVVELLNKRKADLLHDLIKEPVSSLAAVQAKGAHLAAMHEHGSLSYEQAFAFVASFHNPNVRIAR